ncbi:endopeptidase La [Persicimonas caeni]|uniref:Lon protease n=1 Tax=Persicimonas caeni TaxID=2292766 RepID=A0A4Y6PU78_PERCE|nr:endopeptidase La [Persicimonas caeni]QDG51803.1 endopeptidase La [Persicimonas caeni]QED33024.1 endopeptidase La [Persicimonas caeni]
MPFSHDSEGAGDRPTRRLPLLPLRDIIVFPSMVVPLFVGREKSINALEEAMNANKEIALAAQIKSKTNNPTQDDIYQVGTLGRIVQLLRLPDGTVKVLVEGKQRLRIDQYAKNDKYFEVEVELVEPGAESDKDIDALVEMVRSTFEKYVKLNKRVPPEMLSQVAKITDPAKLADTIVAQLSLKLADKQQILEAFDPGDRLEKLYELMQSEIEIQQVERDIRSRVKKQMERTQREFYGKKDNDSKKSGNKKNQFKNDIDELEARIAEKKLPEDARERLEQELRKLKMMSPMSAEATVARNYIDWVLSLPWFEMTEDRLDVAEAEKTLDADHFGLEKPKERILEHLAVQSLVEEPRGPILCFVGPPGVGKTSLGRSIARATNRNFVRLSLGGVRDEAEIRGHRRTYIGSMPGKLIQSLKKAESSNPVFLLDEIDKMSTDFRGDPSAAMLEVLDPEQNGTFNDHYLDLDYDLSKVMFICTANDLHKIPAPLRDRMEIIQIPGYTDREKLKIARRYLIPKQLENNGIADIDVTITDDAIDRVIHHYTREAGVRNLERELGSVCRKIARRVVDGEADTSFVVEADDVSEFLGPRRHQNQRLEREDHVGLTNGMAWTQFGGVMLHAEVTMMAGTGKIEITGKLGDVMQESAKAAISYVRTRAANLGLSPDFHKKVDLHVHFPEGALPKDGPSAGITMATSLVSALTQIPVRHDVAMTGEITLRGRVLPIGGLKEKLLAAHRTGIRTVLIPKQNTKDLEEVPEVVRDALEIVPVKHFDEVLRYALSLEQPEAFLRQLRQPILPPNILLDDSDRRMSVGRSDEEMEPATAASAVQMDDPPIH